MLERITQTASVWYMTDNEHHTHSNTVGHNSFSTFTSTPPALQ